MGVMDRFKNAWNAFRAKETQDFSDPAIHEYYSGAGLSPYRSSLSSSNAIRSIIGSVYNRLAVDAAAISLYHIKTDKDGRFLDVIDSSLNRALTRNANIDQSGRQLIQDAVESLYDEGVIAIVPIETSRDPWLYSEFDIYSLRVGRITQWFPEMVEIDIYNQLTGFRELIKMPKRAVAIVENPFYASMNEPNSTARRLKDLLPLLEGANRMTGANRLDILIQLPYSVKTPLKKAHAEQRRKEIEEQLNNSRYGIAYTDGTEGVTQLNRPVTNTIYEQVKELTLELHNKMGLTERILNGTADEKEIINYYNQAIEPTLAAITDAMKRKWLPDHKIGSEDIRSYRDPFRIVQVNNLAELVDKFTRNEIMSSNEIRSILALKPSDDPKADMLVNANLNQPTDIRQPIPKEDISDEE